MNLQTRIILIIFYLFSQFSFAQWQINKGPYGGNFSVVSGRNDTLFSVVLPNLIYQKENNQD